MTTWVAQHGTGADVAFRIGRMGDELVAEWVGVATLVARRDGSSARLDVAADADPRRVAKVANGGVKLLLRQLEGKPAFHGAAIARNGAAVVLLGRSGLGKSTLAARLCARDGAMLLSDDAVAVDAPVAPNEHWSVCPLEQDHWLDEAAQRATGVVALESAPRCGEKLAVATVRPAPGPRPLRAFVDLAFSPSPAPEPRLIRLRGADALACLVPQAIRFVLDDPDLQRREVDCLVALVEAVPVFRLERARDLERLGESATKIRALLGHLTDAEIP